MGFPGRMCRESAVPRRSPRPGGVSKATSISTSVVKIRRGAAVQDYGTNWCDLDELDATFDVLKNTSREVTARLRNESNEKSFRKWFLDWEHDGCGCVGRALLL